MTDKTLDDLDAVRTVVETLKNFKPDEQQRILRWAVEKIGLPQHISPVLSSQPSVRPSTNAATSTALPTGRTSHINGAVDIKTFIDKKQPRSDVQFAATVAYYLRFEAPPAERKEYIDKEDLQEACRKATRDRLKNPYQTLMNAHNLGLLDKGSEKASFVINTVGENLVAMTLPGDGKTTTRQVKARKPKPEKAKKAPQTKALHGAKKG